MHLPWATHPHILLADQRSKIDLEHLLPKEFGDWRELQQSKAQIINPQQTALLQKLYTQTLSRSYVNSDGVVIMLAIAYGANQSDGVCIALPRSVLPGPGFQMLSKENGTLSARLGDIPVKRLMAKLGNRSEPVTYWSTLGDQVVRGGIQTKLAQIQFGLKGKFMMDSFSASQPSTLMPLLPFPFTNNL
ncbi:MAG: EpsI family protein [Rhodoferax sp.]|nr:EpsI family protein [Rhodoferax sp.]